MNSDRPEIININTIVLSKINYECTKIWTSDIPRAFFNEYGLTLIPAGISNYISGKVFDENGLHR